MAVLERHRGELRHPTGKPGADCRLVFTTRLPEISLYRHLAGISKHESDADFRRTAKTVVEVILAAVIDRTVDAHRTQDGYVLRIGRGDRNGQKKLGNFLTWTWTPIGFGSWAIGGGDWHFPGGRRTTTIRSPRFISALEGLGINWIDTAAVYGLGHSEEVVARALKTAGFLTSHTSSHYQMQPGMG